MSIYRQKGSGGVLFIALVAIVAVGMGMVLYSESQSIKSQEA